MQYRVGARLGLGGMAEVFAGELVGTQAFARPVAIKRILPGYAQNPQFAAMFAAEAAVTARLRHPNIVETLSFERDADGALVLVMELVQGVNLAALMTAGPVPPPVAAFIVAEMLRGLGHAHAQRLVHRDVSPHNVLLSWEGAVKVSDFGIAKARDASEASASVMLKGKPAYMSPEQASAKPLDERSDLFAVGVILWELLTGRSLFKADDTRATLAAVLFGTVPQPRSIARNAPKDLSAIAMRLLEKDRDKRYASTDAVLAELTAAYPAGEAGRRALVAHLTTALSGEPQARQKSNARLLAVSALVIAAAFAVAVAFLGFEEREQSTSPLADAQTPLAIPIRLYNDPSVRSFGRADQWTREPSFKWPSDLPQACRALYAMLDRIHACGKLNGAERDAFRYDTFATGDALLKEWADPKRRDRVRPLCEMKFAILKDLGISFFVDCETSMGDLIPP